MPTLIALWVALLMLSVGSLSFAGFIPQDHGGPAENIYSAVSCSRNPPFSETRALNESVTKILSRPEIQTEQDFAARIISNFQIVKDGDFSSKYFVLRMRPKDWKYYCVLQKEIAKIVPLEERRPTIDLVLTTSEADSVKHSVGIAGGTGPLSDSELLKSVMTELEDKNIDWNHFSINLFSSPPPRTLMDGLRRIRGVSYLLKMAGFATRGHDKYYLASNTAHSKIGEFATMVNFTREGTGTQLHPNAVVDLVDGVAAVALKNSAKKEPDVLILGTLKAYENHLYGKYLSLKGLAEGAGSAAQEKNNKRGHYYTVADSSRAVELQTYIDLAKSGKEEEAGEKIRSFILEEVKRLPRSGRPLKIILGCTEIPMVLNGNQLKKLKKKLTKYRKTEVELLNSEQIFSKKIVDDIQKVVHQGSAD